jgi:hypothetical protein
VQREDRRRIRARTRLDQAIRVDRSRADRESASGGDVVPDGAQDAMLLIGAVEDAVGERLIVLGTHQPVAEVALLFLSSAIAAHGHPSGIGDHPSLFVLVTDHRGQDRKREVLGRAHADVLHHEVEEDVHARAHLGHAMQGWTLVIASLPLNRALTGPTFIATIATSDSGSVRSRDSQPAMHALSVSGSLSAAQVLSTDSGISFSP